jgi:hypothetical protein
MNATATDRCGGWRIAGRQKVVCVFDANPHAIFPTWRRIVTVFIH